MDSKLQIISGRFRGRKLNLPPNARPTQNRARIALFNMLESGIIDTDAQLHVWDVFAGSGAFGLECASRYPNAWVVFTDKSDTSVQTVRKNLSALAVGVNATVNKTEAISVVEKYGAWANLIFVDAPYDSAETGNLFIQKLEKVAKNGTVVIWEQEKDNEFTPNACWKILRDKRYGRARFLIMQLTGE